MVLGFGLKASGVTIHSQKYCLLSSLYTYISCHMYGIAYPPNLKKLSRPIKYYLKSGIADGANKIPLRVHGLRMYAMPRALVPTFGSIPPEGPCFSMQVLYTP